MTTIPPRISIVISVYTSERKNDLMELLGSIESQKYEGFEIIIVIERAKDLALDLKRNYPKALILFSPNPLGLANSRNLGANRAAGDIISFIDDDAVLLPGWANAIVDGFSQSDDIMGVTGPANPIWTDSSLRWFPEVFYWMIGCSRWTSHESQVEVQYAWGVNMSFRRGVFNYCQFSDSYTQGAHSQGKLGPVGDDREFSMRVRRVIGGKIVYSPLARVGHKVRPYKITSRFVRRYAFWQGYSDAMFLREFSAGSERRSVQFHVTKKLLSVQLPSTIRGILTGNNHSRKQLGVLALGITYYILGWLSYPLGIRSTQ